MATKADRKVDLSHDRFNELHSEVAKALSTIGTAKFKVEGTAGLEAEAGLLADLDGAVQLLKRASAKLDAAERVFTTLSSFLKK